MCFNKEMTLGFTILACIFGGWVLSGKGMWNTAKWRRIRISACFFWFAFMEFLQFIQYLVIDDCENTTNIIWTALGWIHIAFQPFFSNLAFSALDRRNLNQDPVREFTWRFILGYSFVTSFLMTLRILLPALFDDIQNFFDLCETSTEGVCGPRTCSTTGLYHVQWNFRMLKPLYPFPGINLHFINMFILPALMGMPAASILLFLTGPFIAMWFPVHDGEKSSIWCFFSIAESFITIMSQYITVRTVHNRNLKSQSATNTPHSAKSKRK